jgi:transposase
MDFTPFFTPYNFIKVSMLKAWVKQKAEVDLKEIDMLDAKRQIGSVKTDSPWDAVAECKFKLAEAEWEYAKAHLASNWDALKKRQNL